MKLSDEEKELIVFGLYMRKNYIETGDPLISAQDARNMGKEKMIKSLNKDQYFLIVQLEELIQKIQKEF